MTVVKISAGCIDSLNVVKLWLFALLSQWTLGRAAHHCFACSALHTSEQKSMDGWRKWMRKFSFIIIIIYLLNVRICYKFVNVDGFK